MDCFVNNHSFHAPITSFIILRLFIILRHYVITWTNTDKYRTYSIPGNLFPNSCCCCEEATRFCCSCQTCIKDLSVLSWNRQQKFSSSLQFAWQLLADLQLLLVLEGWFKSLTHLDIQRKYVKIITRSISFVCVVKSALEDRAGFQHELFFKANFPVGYCSLVNFNVAILGEKSIHQTTAERWF